MKFIVVIISAILIFYGTVFSQESPYQELETVRLQLEDNLFSSISDVEHIPDGFIVLLSRGNQNNLIVALDKTGKIKNVYDKTGNGPGELRHVFNLVECKGLIYASEATSPFVRKFTKELKFLKDYRINKAGRLFPLKNEQFGIWGPNYTDDGAFQLALYDREFNPIRMIYHVKEVPALFHFWGGVVHGPANTYAVFHPVYFQVNFFDENWNFKKKLLDDVPKHVIPYKKYSGSPYTVDNKAIDWSKSWSVLQSVYFSKGNFILKYLYNNRTFIDVFNEEGQLLLKHYQEERGNNLSFMDRDENLWKLKVVKFDDDDPEYYLVKVKLKIMGKGNENKQ